jgi:hypothetical protein
MASLKLVLMILSLVCFLLAALGVSWTRGNLIGAGLFFLTFSLTVT